MTKPAGQKLLTIADALPGKKYVISHISGGHGLRSRLYAIGMVPNETFSVLNESGGGPVTLLVKGARIAIGMGVARKIIIREAEKWSGK